MLASDVSLTEVLTEIEPAFDSLLRTGGCTFLLQDVLHQQQQ